MSPIKQVVVTRVPNNIFDFASGNTIAIEGLVIMQLVGSTRRMLQVGDKTPAVIGGSEAAASFDIEVALEPESSNRLDGFELNNAASSAWKPFVIAFGIAALIFAW